MNLADFFAHTRDAYLRVRLRGLGVAASILVATSGAAATVNAMYEATVPLADRSERGQAIAVQDAMRQVLVRVTGQRDAGTDPALAPLVADARRYVQQFRVVGTDQFFAGFDGAKIERVIIEAGQPVWGQQRPATVIWLAVDDGQRRYVIDGQSNSALKQAVDQAADLRGLPLRWPTGAGSDSLSFADIWSGSPESLRATAADFSAEAVLVGRARTSPGGGSQVHWTLLYGGESSEWVGSATEGVHGTADTFARVFAARGGAGATDVSISVSGVGDLAAYARVTDYLESLTLISNLVVEQLAGDTVTYRAQIRGEAPRLARAIELGNRLQPQQAGTDSLGVALSYRYRP